MDSGSIGEDASSAGDAGTVSCEGNALSLSANGTGNEADTAKARVVVDLMNDLPQGNTQRTIEYWAYVKSSDWVGNANTMYFYGSTARPAHGFGLDFGTDGVAGMAGNHATLDPYTNGGYDADSTADLGVSSTTDQWVHFAMTWDGSAVRTFVNGVERVTKMGDSGTTMLATDASPITIGGYDQESDYFAGLIDEFRVWNVAHSAVQIVATMNSTLTGDEAGLVAYLKFDESSGATAADSVTTAGHTPHEGGLMSATGNPPTFVPSTAPLGCP